MIQGILSVIFSEIYRVLLWLTASPDMGKLLLYFETGEQGAEKYSL